MFKGGQRARGCAKFAHLASGPQPQQTVEMSDALSAAAINWPRDEATGELFDDAWLEAGTRVPLTTHERSRVEYALTHGGKEPPDGQRASKSQVREYWRIKSAYQLHANYMKLEPAVRGASTVRGRGLNEWVEHIDHLKRTGHLPEALDLTGDCTRSALNLVQMGERTSIEKWLIRSAIILRKLGDHSTEVELIQGATANWPQMDELAARLPRAQQLSERSI